jgi:hypothetical protein
MLGTELLVRAEHSRPIGPGAHAVLDYLTVGGFLMLGWRLRHHRRAMALALTNAGMVLAASLITDYPGGVVPKLTFDQHGQLDVAQAALCAGGPALLGFADSPEARPFYMQAGLETAIVSTTDFSDAGQRDARTAIQSDEERGDVIYRNTPTAHGAYE